MYALHIVYLEHRCGQETLMLVPSKLAAERTELNFYDLLGMELSDEEIEAAKESSGHRSFFEPFTVPSNPHVAAHLGHALLCAARDCFKRSGSERTLGRVRDAIVSAEGAVRHVERSDIERD